MTRGPVPILHVRQATGGGGGADRVVVDLVKRLDRRRFSPMVVYLLPEGEVDCSALGQLRQEGVPCLGLAGRRIFDPLQIHRLQREISKHAPGLIHCHDPKSDVMGALVKGWGRGMAAVSTLHGWVRKSRRGHLYAWMDLRALRCFDAVAAVSSHTARLAQDSGLKRVEVIRNGIDTAWWRRQRRSGGVPTIAYVGRLSPEKAPLDFVRVARIVAEAEGASRFIVAGEGPERPAMQAMAREHGLGQRMVFLGHVDSARLRLLYEEIDVLLLTSRTEGLPIAVLEACAMEAPVVATAVGGVPELVTNEQTGLLVPAGDIDGLARGVLRLLRDKALSLRLTKDARLRVEQEFSLDSMVARTEALYTRLLGDG